MRFLFEYKNGKTKETENPSLNVLETFLNEYLIRTFHGDAFECIYVHFISHPSPGKKKLRKRLLYGSMAELEVIQEFENEAVLNFNDFHALLNRVREIIQLAAEVPLKENVNYNVEALLEDFQKCLSFAPHTPDELLAYAKKIKEIQTLNYAKRIDGLIEQDKKHPKPLTKRLEGISIHDPYHLFTPYDYVYSELFTALLRQEEIYLPGYSEIHIHMAETITLAKQELALEPWYKFTYGEIDINHYKESSEEEKKEMLLDSIVDALRYIIDFDHLERDAFEKVIQHVKETGTNIKLLYMKRENKKYSTEVKYQIPSRHTEEALFTLHVTNLNTQETATVPIDTFNTFWAGANFGKIVFKKDEIIIRGRDSYQAQLTRDSQKKPYEYLFNLQNLFSRKEENKF
ncbi:hypothetical protein U8V72_21475 [Priestia filamentosa]|uniref:hypothetical protein n=1 Tax=Priestia filamentosa TaxID=1402861 RepID=UPI00397B3C97